MNETDLLARIGRLVILRESQDAEYAALLGVLAGVLKGDISPGRVLVDLTNRRWQVVEANQKPLLPPTINGLPEVVVGTDPPPPPEPWAGRLVPVKPETNGIPEEAVYNDPPAPPVD